MPNPYHYFESGEVSHERLLLEIELLKQLQEADLLHDLDWKLYDTPALTLFVQAGIEEANDELTHRHINISNEFKQYDFIHQCIQHHQLSPIKDTFPQQTISIHLILNLIILFISLIFILGLYLYEHFKFNSQHRLLNLLNHPLTTKRRHLSFIDDLSIILLAFASSLLLGCTIVATRYSRKLILLGIFTLLIILTLLIKKTHQIITFLFQYREFRWPLLYDYMYS